MNTKKGFLKKYKKKFVSFAESYIFASLSTQKDN